MKTSLDNSPLLCVQPPGREKNGGGGKEGDEKEGQVGEERLKTLERLLVPFSLSLSLCVSVCLSLVSLEAMHTSTALF